MINYEIIGDRIVFTSDKDYSIEMEYGMPPLGEGNMSEAEKDDIEDWAHRHGLKSGKGIVKSIELKGIKVGTPEAPLHITSFGRNSYRPFLRPAIHQMEGEIKDLLKQIK
jgi:hypothetical protein